MDTVIIRSVKFKVSKPDLFLPEFRMRRLSDLSDTERWSKRPYARSFTLQPYAYDGYYPAVVIRESVPNEGRRMIYTIQVTVSLPKLVHGNSVVEVVPSDLERICVLLESRMRELGIAISANTIRGARVYTVHFCKNIPLPRERRAQEILDELSRVDINRTVDVTKKTYKNGGRLLHIYSGVRQYCFYEKISDALKTGNRRTNKEVDEIELSFIERMGLKKQEIFRYEYRLTRQSVMEVEINRALKRDSGFPVLFSTLFVPDLWKKMILQSWKHLSLRQGNLLSLKSKESTYDLRLLSTIIAANKGRTQTAHSLNKALAAYGLTRLVRDHGLKASRSAIHEVWSSSHSERITARLKEAEELAASLSCSNSISFIAGKLEDFQTIDLASLRRGVDFRC